MSKIFQSAAFFLLVLTPAARADSVRIGLFGLFKPDTLHIRLASGQTATLEADGLANSANFTAGDSIRVRAVGARLNIVLVDTYGRIKRAINASEARILSADTVTLELSLPGKIKRIVRGELMLSAQKRNPRGQLQIVLATSREAVVASVVAAEMGGARAGEAIKALAIVVRTFMLSHPMRHKEDGFDYCDTTHCQVYRGEDDLVRAQPVIAENVRATEGEVLSFKGHLIEAYYTAVCGGLTATPEMVWGGSTGDGYTYRRIECRWCHGSPHFEWQRSADASVVLGALSSSTGLRLSQSCEVLVEKDVSSDFVRSVIIRDRGRETILSGDEFRRSLGRRLGWNTVLSPTFMIERRSNTFVFRGRGFGSQVGLCLAGAFRQAEAGRGYREILSFYFPETEMELQAGREINDQGRIDHLALNQPAFGRRGETGWSD